MWKDENIEDLELGEEDLPLVEIEFDEENEDRDRGRGKGLKILIVGIVICLLLAAGYFITRYLLDSRSRRDELSTGNLSSQQSSVTSSDAQSNPAENDSGNTEEPVPTPVPTPTPTPVPTPTPTPTAPPIPEEYLIPGIEAGDLEAVRAHIQTQLDAFAEDLNCPNIDEISMNDDGTVFTVVVTSLNESGKEREIVNDFYNFGRTYAAYAGKTVENIHIDYRNQHGDLLWTRDSNQSP